MDLNDAFYFVQVVEKKGFTAASRALGIPKSRLSRRVKNLEEHLGARLLQRTSRRMAITEIGQEYYDHARSALDRIEAAEAAVQRRTNALEGSVTVSCSVGMAQFGLARIIPRFLKENPRVRIAQQVSNRMVDLVQGNIDLAIRGHMTNLPDSSLIQTRLARVSWRLFGGVEYLDHAGRPDGPDALIQHTGLCLGHRSGEGQWTLSGPDGLKASIPYQVRLASDDMSTLKIAAINGLGLVALPAYVCRAEVKAGTLECVLPEWSAGEPQISLIMPSRQGLPPAVEAFSKYIRDALPGAIEV
ncbi:MAG: LysR substrate-binding domain-containing protein [Pseudomonadota bacterium]